MTIGESIGVLKEYVLVNERAMELGLESSKDVIRLNMAIEKMLEFAEEVINIAYGAKESEEN